MKFKNRMMDGVMWVIILVYVAWYIFISLATANPMGLIPVVFAGCVAFFLWLQHSLLSMTMKFWAVYILITVSIKILTAYLHSVTMQTNIWSISGQAKNVIFLLLAGFLLYCATQQIETEEEKK